MFESFNVGAQPLDLMFIDRTSTLKQQVLLPEKSDGCPRGGRRLFPILSVKSPVDLAFVKIKRRLENCPDPDETR
jgi:hypothetical protein